MFSLVDGLPSRPSAGALPPPLFGPFVGTTPSSDSPGTCTLAVRLMAFANRPANSHSTGIPGVSRFSRVEYPNMPGSRTAQSPDATCADAASDVAFRMDNAVGTLKG